MQILDDSPRTLRYDTPPAAIVLLAALIAGCGIALCVLLAIAKGLDRVTKLEAALANVATCATPPKDGDRAVVTILHHKGQLVTSCQLTTNWKQPERIGK